MTEMPKSLRIGPYVFPVLVGNKADLPDRAFGCNHTGPHRDIRIVEGLDPVLMVDTLIHEMIHAIWWVDRLEQGDTEERIVNNTATFLVQAFLDNPTLCVWIEETLAPHRQKVA